MNFSKSTVDATSGARVGALDYTPYGKVKASQPGGVLPDFQYAGLMWVGEVGLNASATRFYDGATTRWMTRDWIRERGGINLYGYVGGNPLNSIDPEGTEEVIIIIPSPVPFPQIMMPGTPEYQELNRQFNRWGNNAQINLQNWWDLICQMASPGKWVDSGIEKMVGELQSAIVRAGNKRPDRCEVLQQLIDSGQISAGAAKPTQKAWGCRPSRMSKDKM